MLFVRNHGSTNDPDDFRVEAGKIFANALGGNDEIALAAFSGSQANDRYLILNDFTKGIGPILTSLDELAGSEGGGTPLYNIFLCHGRLYRQHGIQREQSSDRIY